jgi:hypothetical protein
VPAAIPSSCTIGKFFNLDLFYSIMVGRVVLFFANPVHFINFNVMCFILTSGLLRVRAIPPWTLLRSGRTADPVALV